MMNYIFTVLLIFIFLIWLEYIYLRNINIHKYLNSELYNNPYVDIKTHTNKTLISKQKIIFTGLARNIENKINKNIQQCIHLGLYFHKYKIIIFENDSQDNTRQIIEKIAQTNNNVELIECINNKRCQMNECKLYEYGIMNRNRIDRMAFYRNICLYMIYEKYNTYDYVCMIDWDIDGVVPISLFLNTFNNDIEWSCICANGRSPLPGTFGLFDTMYDAMALCLIEKDFVDAKSNRRDMYSLILKYIRLIHISMNLKHLQYQEVLSAFNGFCIYKLQDILNLYYKYGYNCEHISLNEQLINKKKKIYIDHLLKIYVGHQGPTKITQFI